MAKAVGTVYIVGAGPGNPELITCRGRDLIEQADVLVYDRLVADELLARAPVTATRIYAGKSPQQCSRHRMETIKDTLVEYAKQGRDVLRLHGGDPCVFGRGGEEISHLEKHGVPYEVVPGVSCITAAPASEGIPLTCRGLASNVAVFSGHAADTGEPRVDWQLAARADTAVFLMAIATLPQVLAALLEHGRAADTPAAIIERGTQAQQRMVRGTVESFLTELPDVSAPATLIVGQTVGRS